MATQTTAVENRTETKIPAIMKAVVYRGVNDMRLETVPGQSGHLRHLRHGFEENLHRLALGAAHLRP
jgi:hypothetical protein